MGLLIALGLTILIECSIVLIQSRDIKWTGYMALVNVVTNPTINLILLFVSNRISRSERQLLIYILEVLVVISEGVMIYLLRRTESFKVKPLKFHKCL
ncbi:MAG: hypothetical protein MJ124_07860, partial [Lachnospiraceae bacterium]|nr:hypothetical protein [Lachnospiraceae bacterium]